MISKEDLEKLAELSRMKLESGEEKKLLKDLEKILAHFEELKEVNTEGVAPLSGGTESENVFREDEDGPTLERGGAIEQFPEQSGGYLKVPPVF